MTIPKSCRELFNEYHLTLEEISNQVGEMSKNDLTIDCLLAKEGSNRIPQASLQCSNSGGVLSGVNAKPKYDKLELNTFET